MGAIADTEGMSRYCVLAIPSHMFKWNAHVMGNLSENARNQHLDVCFECLLMQQLEPI